jgi:hypothetical protein
VVALNVSSQFAGMVEIGRKKQTIREKARAKPGDLLQLYVGQRTKACRRLGWAVCKDVIPVTLTPVGIAFDADKIRTWQADEIARLDGFADYYDMWKWFSDRYKVERFTGHIIQWDQIHPDVPSL